LCERFRSRDIPALGTFVSAAEQYDDTIAAPDEINPASGPVVDAQLADAFANRNDVAKIPEREEPYSDQNARLRLSIP
jgi:hypothetical protein